MEGLLNFIKSPAGQGLLAAVAGGMANARQGTPWNNVGRGLVSGIQGYSGALDQEARAAQAAQAQEMQALQRQQLEMNMAAAQRQLEQQRAQDAWRSGLPDIISKATNPTFGAGEEGPTMAPANPDVLNQYLMKAESPFLADMLKQKVMPGGDYRDVVVGGDLVRSGPDGIKVLHSAPRNESLPAEQRLYNLAKEEGYKGDFMSFLRDRVTNAEGAKAELDLVSVPQSDGSTRMLPRSQAVRSISGGQPQRPAQTIPTQGNASMTPELWALIQADAAKNGGGAPVVNLNSNTPGSVFGIDTPMLGVSPSAAAVERTKAEAESAKSTQKDRSTARKFLNQARFAEELLKQNPTGSGIGALRDKTLEFFGQSTPASEAAQQLEAVSGWLVSNVPRMEGPQSNFDVDNYMRMAAAVGDRTKPTPVRLAALTKIQEMMREVIGEESGKDGGTPSPARNPQRTGQFRIIEVE